jgi:hypothetical protein
VLRHGGVGPRVYPRIREGGIAGAQLDLRRARSTHRSAPAGGQGPRRRAYSPVEGRAALRDAGTASPQTGDGEGAAGDHACGGWRSRQRAGPHQYTWRPAAAGGLPCHQRGRLRRRRGAAELLRRRQGCPEKRTMRRRMLFLKILFSSLCNLVLYVFSY